MAGREYDRLAEKPKHDSYWGADKLGEAKWSAEEGGREAKRDQG